MTATSGTTGAPPSTQRLDRRALALFRALERSGLLGLGVVDAERRVIHASDELARIAGLAPSRLIGRTMLEFVSSSEAQRLGCLPSVTEAGGEDLYTLAIRGADGRDRDVLMVRLPLEPGTDDDPDAAVGLVFDLGRLFETEDTLVKNARLLLQPFDLIAQPVFVQDLDGVFRLANQAFCEGILDLPRDRVLGHSIRDLGATLGSDRLRSLLQLDQLELADDVFQFRTAMLVDHDRTEREYEIQKTVLHDHRGLPNGTMGILIDVTRRRRAERDLARALDDAHHLNEHIRQQRDLLVQTEKLASVGQLAAGIAHEINNPLSYVRSNVQTLAEYLGSLGRVLDRTQALLERSPDDDPQRLASDLASLRNQFAEEDVAFVMQDAGSLIDDCLRGADRIRRIVDGMRGFSRQDDQPIEVPVAEMLETALLMAVDELKFRVRVITELTELPPIRCFQPQIEQALLHLLVNAAQAIDAQGTIRVTATAAAPRHVRISVADDGPGIAPELQERIFEPFFTTRETGEGTGLGLHIVAVIVERHGGHVDVVSTPGEGTVVHVTLPVDGAEVDA
jgi:PAS domain S-box-containing protein